MKIKKNQTGPEKMLQWLWQQHENANEHGKHDVYYFLFSSSSVSVSLCSWQSAISIYSAKDDWRKWRARICNSGNRDLFWRVWKQWQCQCQRMYNCTYLMSHRIDNAIVSLNAFTFPNSNNTFANDCTIILHTVAIIFRFFAFVHVSFFCWSHIIGRIYIYV